MNRKYQQDYHRANKDKVRVARSKYLRQRRISDPAWRQKRNERCRDHYYKRYGDKTALAALFDSQLGRCANPYCAKSLKGGCQIDHIMPLARRGKNVIENFAFLCINCNQRKNDRHPDEWLESERLRTAA